MGRLFTFKCDSCEYTVESVGKEDKGFISVLKPYICYDCKKVRDVLVGEMGEVVPEDMVDGVKFVNHDQKNFYSCPNCFGKNLTEWKTNSYICPKCNGTMAIDRNAPTKMWD